MKQYIKYDKMPYAKFKIYVYDKFIAMVQYNFICIFTRLLMLVKL